MNSAPRPHFSIPVVEASQAGEARRVAMRVATEIGFDETDAGRVAIVVTELARNLAKHAKEGEILVRGVEAEGKVAVEIISLDKGPGLDVSAAMEDGYSTSGTPGMGLGAIRRLSQFLDIYSSPQHGTIIVSRLWTKAGEPIQCRSEFGVVNVPVKGETVCGDSWMTMDFGGRMLAMVVDGLGHGVEAAEASAEAVRVMREYSRHCPCEILDASHGALRKTRGAAMSVLESPYGSTSCRYAGIGNISASILSDAKSQSLVSHNGTIGVQVRKCQEFEYSFDNDALVVMHSDGLVSQWDLRKYPGLTRKHPAVVASVLYRDYKRGRDDVTVLVVRKAA